jgi:hypothetical protein
MENNTNVRENPEDRVMEGQKPAQSLIGIMMATTFHIPWQCFCTTVLVHLLEVCGG